MLAYCVWKVNIKVTSSLDSSAGTVFVSHPIEILGLNLTWCSILFIPLNTKQKHRNFATCTSETKIRKLQCYTTWSPRHFYRYCSEIIETFVTVQRVRGKYTSTGLGCSNGTERSTVVGRSNGTGRSSTILQYTVQ